MTVLNRLAELNLTLPEAPKPAATYVTVRREGDLVYVSGQGPMVGADPVVTGRVGESVTEQQGYDAARLAVLNALAALHDAIGLERIARIVRLTGWVSSANDFYRQHRVVDGASDLLVSLFGENGLHTRCALGVNVLPFNIPVEIELTAAIAP
ncbi:RidA family protein [Paraburkholderia acidisoli]|uniref:RidA family protein n=1 Tax=Paraburkholderia acidisoli TaxID=2571748 RepID=A0A7Z2JHT8_9BURK|nr:RidA family protein [Paraburkholderia acidisoli]QGZ65076.1 RidA family protein [Paraburkholderia acidisoli]